MIRSKLAVTAVLAVLGVAGLAVPAAAQAWKGVGTLGLEVKAGRRDPIEGAQVRLRYAEIDPIDGPPPATTGADGRVEVQGLAAGRWRVDISKQGYSSYLLVVAVESHGETRIVSGPVRDATGDRMRIELFEVTPDRLPGPALVIPPEARPRERPREPEPAPPARPEPAPARPEPAPAPAEPEPAPTEPEPAPAEPAPAEPEAVPAEPAPAEPEPMPEPAPPAPAAPPEPEEVPEPTAPAAEPEPEAPEAAPVAPARPPGPVPEPDEMPPPESAAAPAPAPEPPAEQPEPPPAPAPAEEPEPEQVPQPPAPSPQPPPERPVPPVAETPPPPAAEPRPAPPPAAEVPPPQPPAAPARATPSPSRPTASPAPDQAAQSPPLPRISATVTSSAEGTCPECRPGQSAVMVEQLVGASALAPAEDCVSDLAERLDRIAALLADAGVTEAGPLISGTGGALQLLRGTSAANEVAALVTPFLRRDSSCQALVVVLPPGASYTGYSYEASDAFGTGPCTVGAECAIGSAFWAGEPTVVHSEGVIMVYGVFRNASQGRQRRAVMTVYFEP